MHAKIVMYDYIAIILFCVIFTKKYKVRIYICP